MTVGFPLYEENYLWTNRGLLHLYELHKNDKILGDKNGVLSWVEFKGLKTITEKHNSIELISDNNGIKLPENAIISTFNGYKNVNNVTIDDNIFTYSNKDINEFILLINVDYKDYIIYLIKRDLEIKITPIVSYLLGKYFFYEDTNKKNIKIQFNEANHVQKVYYDFLHSFNLKQNDIICYVNWATNELIIKSKIFDTLKNQFSEYPKIPLVMRLSPTASVQAFLLGLFENNKRRLRKRGNNYVMKTLLKELEIRSFILNYLFIFGIRPKKISVSNTSDEVFIDIYLDSKDILNMNKESILVNTSYDNTELDDIYPKIQHINKKRENKYYLLNYPLNIQNFRLICNANLITPIQIS